MKRIAYHRLLAWLGAMLLAVTFWFGLLMAMDHALRIREALGQESPTWNVLVRWNPNTEGDLEGYRLWENGGEEPAADIPVGTEEVTLTRGPGAYEYQLSAYDVSGNESQRSEPVTLRLDQEAPMRPSLRMIGDWTITWAQPE